jgi:hypothetical protein
VIYAADQIYGVILGAQTGRFYVQQKEIGQRSYCLQELVPHAYIDCFAYDSHADLLPKKRNEGFFF